MRCDTNGIQARLERRRGKLAKEDRLLKDAGEALAAQEREMQDLRRKIDQQERRWAGREEKRPIEVFCGCGKRIRLAWSEEAGVYLPEEGRSPKRSPPTS